MSRAAAGCYVISLRPVGAHAPMRRAAARTGARVLALSPWRIVQRDDAAARRALAAALAADVVLFTSPAAVQAAARLRRLRPRRGQAWCAVGAGTAAALRRAGVAEVQAPTRMDSEGLLALPVLQALRGRSVGLVTAPGGRGTLAPALAQRGARVLRADVYERMPVPPSPAARARLRALRARPWLALGSGEALARLLAALPADDAARLRRARVVAASERLRALARAQGFAEDAVVAASARPADLLAAVQAAALHSTRRPQPPR
ncbi:MAG TPA: uroporphyrinogen-III synthase [Xanthomonadaceae bacterium]|nr:uroporphyrinogen-III synthase [Xanthomonadaceae bacterium]